MTSENEQEIFDDYKVTHGRNGAGSAPSPTNLNTEKDFAAIPPHLRVDEVHNDYYGLPSNPISIYHTGPAWPLSAGPHVQRIPREARPVCVHAITPVWRQLGERIYKHFDSIDLKWTSIDPVRFAEAGKEPGPLFLWVGVMPETLSHKDAKAAAVRCKEILAEYEIVDVEIAFRESVFTRSAGPQLLDHLPPFNPTADVRSPFTPALGLQIAPKTFPYFEGTGCLYICEGGKSDRIFLLTARHVVIPPSKYSNDLYHHKDSSMPRHEVVHLGIEAYQNALDAIRVKISGETTMINYYKGEINRMGEAIKDEDSKTTTTRDEFKAQLAVVEASKASVNEFQGNITRFWSEEDQRILGHVLYAPPISISGDRQFTEDWALIELDHRKFNWDTFRGNVIYLGIFRPISLRPSGLTIISRNQIYNWPTQEKDVPSC